MRKWINIICESPDFSSYSNWSQEDFIRDAGAWSIVVPGDPPEAGMPAENYVWHFDPAYPVAKLAGGDWGQWMKEEIKMWADDGQPDRYDDMFDRDIYEPIVITEVDGQGWLWDGCHRTGAATLRGLTTLPAIVGTPKGK